MYSPGGWSALPTNHTMVEEFKAQDLIGMMFHPQALRPLATAADEVPRCSVVVVFVEVQQPNSGYQHRNAPKGQQGKEEPQS